MWADHLLTGTCDERLGGQKKDSAPTASNQDRRVEGYAPVGAEPFKGTRHRDRRRRIESRGTASPETEPYRGQPASRSVRQAVGQSARQAVVGQPVGQPLEAATSVSQRARPEADPTSRAISSQSPCLSGDTAEPQIANSRRPARSRRRRTVRARSPNEEGDHSRSGRVRSDGASNGRARNSGARSDGARPGAGHTSSTTWRRESSVSR